MSLGPQLLAWRRHGGLSQADLAEKAGLVRPYLSRLERNSADPSLSVVRRLAAALGISVGDLVEGRPLPKPLSRQALDRLARGALRPGHRAVRGVPTVRALARALRDRRAAIGLYKPRKPAPLAKGGSVGLHALRRLRSELGEAQWKALLARIDKHASAWTVPPP